MNPEQRLFVIHKYFTVKFFVFFIRTFIRMFHPQRMNIAERHRTFVDFHLFFCGGNLNNLFFSIFIFFFFCFSLFMDVFYNHIIFSQIGLIDCLIFLLGTFFRKENLNRHKRTIFFDYFTNTVFVGELHAVFVQEKCNLCTDSCFISFCHIVLCASVALPVYRSSPFFIGQCINMNILCHHKCRVKSKSKVTDNLIFISLIFIFLKEFCSTGESNLSNILFNFICSHTDTIINKLQSFFLRINDNFNLALEIIRKRILSHHFQLFQFCNSITAIGN